MDGMKNLISLSLIFLLSCSQVPVQKSELDSLEALLDQDDLKIHRCLQKRGNGPVSMDLKRECLSGTKYDYVITRSPSDDSENEIIMKNNWFFGDKMKLDEFYRLSRGFAKAAVKMAKHQTDDFGIGVEGAAFFGFGTGWAAEVVNHHGKIGVFCAPNKSMVTDIGLEAKLNFVHSISCPSNQAYEGGFLTVGASISGEAIGIPVDLGGAYSFGLDLPGFARRIQTSGTAGKIKLGPLALEVARISNSQTRNGITRSNNGYAAMMNLALLPLGILGIHPPSISTVRNVNVVVKNALAHHRSMGIQFKDYYRTYLQAHLARNNFPMLNEFFSQLTQSMTGCDSIGGSAALALSLSPVALSVTYENYSLLMEMIFEDLRVLKLLTPMALLNPLLMQAEDLRAITRVSRNVLAMPGRVSRNCSEVSPRI